MNERKKIKNTPTTADKKCKPLRKREEMEKESVIF